MHSDRFASRIEGLDPESRAIVDLSLGRGISDGELATMLGVGTERVRQRRERALERLGASTGRDREAVVAALGGHRGAAPAAAATPRDERHPGAASVVDASPRDGRHAGAGPEAVAFPRGERPPRRRRLVLSIAGGLLVMAVAGLVLALLGGNADPAPTPGSEQPPGGAGGQQAGGQQGGGQQGGAETGGQGDAAPDRDGPPGAEGEQAGAEDGEATEGAVRLEPVAGGRGRGTASVLRREGEPPRLRVRVRGLRTAPRRGYGIWLYNSVSDARLIGGSDSGTFQGATLPLPADADRYMFLDVSREPTDANPNHSGASVLRAPLGDLLRR